MEETLHNTVELHLQEFKNKLTVKNNQQWSPLKGGQGLTGNRDEELSEVMVIFSILIATRVTQVYTSIKTLCKCYSQDLCISLYAFTFYLKKIMNIY